MITSGKNFVSVYKNYDCHKILNIIQKYRWEMCRFYVNSDEITL